MLIFFYKITDKSRFNVQNSLSLVQTLINKKTCVNVTLRDINLSITTTNSFAILKLAAWELKMKSLHTIKKK